MPLVPALCAESESMSRHETHFTDDHTATMEEASFFSNICTQMPTKQLHMAQLGVHQHVHGRPDIVHSFRIYMHGWNRKLAWLTHSVPSTHTSGAAQHSLTPFFSLRENSKQERLLVIPVARNFWLLLVHVKFEQKPSQSHRPSFHPEAEETRDTTKICLPRQRTGPVLGGREDPRCRMLLNTRCQCLGQLPILPQRSPLTTTLHQKQIPKHSLTACTNTLGNEPTRVGLQQHVLFSHVVASFCF